MSKEVQELEKILNQEIEAYQKLEEYINEKNNYLVKSDIEKVKEIDVELEKYNFAVKKLEQKRKDIYPDNLTLKEIIDRIEDKEQADNISNLRGQIKEIIPKVQKKNKINQELLKFSLKLVENSLTSIANVIAPEGAAYTRQGASKTRTSILSISSVDHEI
jgi:hypothetical protein